MISILVPPHFELSSHHLFLVTLLLPYRLPGKGEEHILKRWFVNRYRVNRDLMLTEKSDDIADMLLGIVQMYRTSSLCSST